MGNLYVNHRKTLNLFSILIIALLWGPLAIAQESDPVKLFFKNGEAFRTIEHYKEAIAEYDKALAIDDTYQMIHYWKGVCHFIIKEYDQSIASLERAIELSPNYKAAYSALMKVYNELGNNEKSIETFERVADIEEDPLTKVNMYRRVINMQIEEGNNEAAIVNIEKALEVDPGNLEIRYLESDIYNNLGQYRKAIEVLEPVMDDLNKLSPDNRLKFYYELGYAYHYMKEYDKSNEYFKKAYDGPFKSLISKLQPSHFFNVAYGYSKIYEYETCERLLKKVLEIDPTYAQAYDLLADVAIKQEHHHKGLEYYEQAVEGLGAKSNDLEDIYAEKFIPTLLNNRDYEIAVQLANEALAKFPNSVKIKYLKAIGLHHQDKNVEAIKIMEEVVANKAASSPMDYALYNFALGIIYKTNGNLKEAEEAFKLADKGPYRNASLYAYESTLEEEMMQAQNKGAN